MSVIPPIFSWWIFLLLLLVLAASVIMFSLLVLRWTVYHRWAELQQWAEENGLKLRGRHDAVLAPPLSNIKQPTPVPELSIDGPRMAVIEISTRHGDSAESSRVTRWHAVVKPIDTYWYPTGLRPRANPSSLLDLFPLTSFPSALPPDRFVIFGTDSAAVRLLARSKLAALLPPDVGLLLHEQTLLLDFSSRPLDTIELSRLTALLDQIAANLPAAGGE